MLKPAAGTERVLQAVGEILEAEGQSVAIVVVGGSALSLLGVVERVTRDVDVIAFGHPPDAPAPELQAPPEQLPQALARAAALVAADFGLDEDWINTGPALQWKQGLPPGLEGRVRWRRYANLNVGVADRRDLVFLKLYAAADATGPASVHYQDLIALRPTDKELQSARAWTLTQDASPDFHRVVDQVVQHVSRDTRTTRR
jgi:hypothetical protein